METQNETTQTSPCRGWWELVFYLPFILIGVVLMLFGCAVGWLWAAFMSGVRYGMNDWNEKMESDRDSQGD